MFKDRFFTRCLAAAIAIPLLGIAAIAAMPKRALAKEGCSCDKALCDKAIGNCYLLICSDGSPQQQCYGKYKVK